MDFYHLLHEIDESLERTLLIYLEDFPDFVTYEQKQEKRSQRLDLFLSFFYAKNMHQVLTVSVWTALHAYHELLRKELLLQGIDIGPSEIPDLPEEDGEA